MFDAIVLAGGAGRRLGGIDKPALEVGGQSLLDHVIAGVVGAGRVVVVGPARAPGRPTPQVRWCREDPPGGGPVAAVAAALPLTDAEVVVVLAADMPGIGPAVPVLVGAMVAAVGVPSGDSSPGARADVAVLVGADGRRSLLAAAWLRAALAEAIGRIGDPHGMAMRAVYRDARVLEIADPAGWADDCDTWDDVARARSARVQDRTRSSPA